MTNLAHTYPDGTPVFARLNPQPNALARMRDPRSLAVMQSAGDAITRALQAALQEYLGYRKRDGQLFSPRIIDASLRLHRETRLPDYYMIVVHPNTLFHFDLGEMTAPGLLVALSAAIGRHVIVLDNHAGDYPPEFQRGIIYLVSLIKDAPSNPSAAAATASVRLPKKAHLLDALTGQDDLRGKLRVPLGVSAEGEVWRELPAIKHARFVGMSGSGKTMMIHCALAALMDQNAPAQLRVALIDLKRNEFVFWKDAPHRWGEVARDVDEAENLLREIEIETRRRNDLLGAALRRNIQSYNAIAPAPLPYLLVVVDEARDLINQAGARSPIAKLLQSISTGGRSAGVYLWAATQYASAAHGLSRATSENLRSFVFRVADETSARVAGCPGAQNIPASAPGRLLARLRDDAEPTPLQGFFLDDDELRVIGARIAGAANEPVPVRLTEDEFILGLYARDQLRGKFTIAALAEAHRGRISQRRIEDISRTWESRGWLAVGATRAEGKTLAPELLAVLDTVAKDDRTHSSQAQRKILTFARAS